MSDGLAFRLLASADPYVYSISLDVMGRLAITHLVRTSMTSQSATMQQKTSTHHSSAMQAISLEVPNTAHPP